MIYLKIFESNSLPTKCSGDFAIKKINSLGKDKFTNSENELIKAMLSNSFKDFDIQDSSFLIRKKNHNFVINKLQDDWFVIHVDYSRYGYGYERNRYYICDEFVELDNFMKSIIKEDRF